MVASLPASRLPGAGIAVAALAALLAWLALAYAAAAVGAIASIAARSLAVRGRPQRETRRPTVRAIGC